MARGKLRIRQRGSRQQWARVREHKTFGPDETPESDALKLLSASDVVKTLRCGMCGLVVEQTLRDGRTVAQAPYRTCRNCEELRCTSCLDAEDDPCVDDAERHAFAEE